MVIAAFGNNLLAAVKICRDAAGRIGRDLTTLAAGDHHQRMVAEPDEAGFHDSLWSHRPDALVNVNR